LWWYLIQAATYFANSVKRDHEFSGTVREVDFMRTYSKGLPGLMIRLDNYDLVSGFGLYRVVRIGDTVSAERYSPTIIVNGSPVGLGHRLLNALILYLGVALVPLVACPFFVLCVMEPILRLAAG
jgi:hypothetical protein